MSKITTLATIASGLIILSLTGQCYGTLQVGFYKGKCKFANVEDLVGGVVSSLFFRDRNITAALLRMQFHDCFVNGCDASILLDGSNTEKTTPPNLSVRGYDIIDAAKSAVEAICPGVVSCADIIAMATRDAVALSGGGRYNVETGRKDGLVSRAQDVMLPAPTISVSDSITFFGARGFSPVDMVYLLGGHTVGIAHCSLFQSRLYNFKNTGKPDPSMNPSLLSTLRIRCPQNATSDNTTFLDQNPLSSTKVDNSYYQQILSRKGILQIDQDIALDQSTTGIVNTIASRSDFTYKFGAAMVKLGALQVPGAPGEIRRSCRAINK